MIYRSINGVLYALHPDNCTASSLRGNKWGPTFQYVPTSTWYSISRRVTPLYAYLKSGGAAC